MCYNPAVKAQVFLCAAGLVMVAAPVYAEVMDKEPTITINWLYAVIGGGIALVAWRWRWWLGLAFSVLWLPGLWVMHQEIADASVGRDIRLEAGQRYVTHFYLSAAVAIALQAGAFYMAWRTHRARRNRTL